MALLHGYGVVIGTFDHYVRDPINNFGQYYHENLYINTPAGQYHCAIDVDTNKTNDGIEWRVIPLSASDLKGIELLPNGWHVLASNPTSGAIDYIRSTQLHRQGCGVVFVREFPFFEWLRNIFNRYNNPPWTAGNSQQALDVLEPLLANTQRLFVFGEPFTNGLGVHNIHQNQGDPHDPNHLDWWNENGIWQDGVTIIQKANGSYVGFLNKFKTQSYTTDNNGHPSP